VGEAAPRFFHHTPEQITPAEGALLAAVLPSPKHLKADRPSAYVQRRVDTILGLESTLGGTTYLKKFEQPEPEKAVTAKPGSSLHRSSR